MRGTTYQTRHWFLDAFFHLISNQCCEIRITIITNLELRKLDPDRLKYLAKVTELIYCRTCTEIHIPLLRLGSWLLFCFVFLFFVLQRPCRVNTATVSIFLKRKQGLVSMKGQNLGPNVNLG